MLNVFTARADVHTGGFFPRCLCHILLYLLSIQATSIRQFKSNVRESKGLLQCVQVVVVVGPSQSKATFPAQLAFPTTTTVKQLTEPGGDNSFSSFSSNGFHRNVPPFCCYICFNVISLSNSFLICTLDNLYYDCLGK